jgi:AAA15 family ATPase/GTPase
MQLSIIEFSVENFKIFKERATFSMTSRKSDGRTFQIYGENLLRTSFVYGPNASGKTSLFDALLTLKRTALHSAEKQLHYQLQPL